MPKPSSLFTPSELRKMAVPWHWSVFNKVGQRPCAFNLLMYSTYIKDNTVMYKERDFQRNCSCKTCGATELVVFPFRVEKSKKQFHRVIKRSWQRNTKSNFLRHFFSPRFFSPTRSTEGEMHYKTGGIEVQVICDKNRKINSKIKKTSVTDLTVAG